MRSSSLAGAFYADLYESQFAEPMLEAV